MNITDATIEAGRLDNEWSRLNDTSRARFFEWLIRYLDEEKAHEGAAILEEVEFLLGEARRRLNQAIKASFGSHRPK